jgi:OOP family OmpA-OmpF porin
VQAPVRCDFSVTLESDQSFEFNKVQLRPAAKKRIDNEILAKLLACAKVDLILVTGHADRLGAQRYNQLLSLRRAEAVASYLKNKHVAAKIETFGMGKTQSIKDCADALPHKKLISCLAPNRRVTVEVRGLVKAR